MLLSSEAQLSTANPSGALEHPSRELARMLTCSRRAFRKDPSASFIHVSLVLDASHLIHRLVSLVTTDSGICTIYVRLCAYILVVCEARCCTVRPKRLPAYVMLHILLREAVPMVALGAAKERAISTKPCTHVRPVLPHCLPRPQPPS